MTDAEILQEIERRIYDWLRTPGWADENAGFREVLRWVKELRNGEPMSKYKCCKCGKESEFGFQAETDSAILEYCKKCFKEDYPNLARAFEERQPKPGYR